jgi:hypothetical protein
LVSAQQPAQPSSQPQVKVHVLNVCSPSPQDQKEIAAALDKVPREPLFGLDFEVDRGRSILETPAGLLQSGVKVPASSDSKDTADWVRIRREFAVQAMFASVQYSFSKDAESMNETLVFRVRDPKDLMELSIEDSASAVTSPASMLATDTPASHVKLERFGKSSVVLARCSGVPGGPAPDQSAYEPLFRHATAIVTRYRSLLRAREMVPGELSRVADMEGHKAKSASPPASKMRKPSHPQK